jgi:hypothetical protein
MAIPQGLSRVHLEIGTTHLVEKPTSDYQRERARTRRSVAAWGVRIPYCLTLSVAANGRRGEDRHSGRARCDGPEQITGDGSSLGEGPDGVGGSGDGLDSGEGLQVAPNTTVWTMMPGGGRRAVPQRMSLVLTATAAARTRRGLPSDGQHRNVVAVTLPIPPERPG